MLLISEIKSFEIGFFSLPYRWYWQLEFWLKVCFPNMSSIGIVPSRYMIAVTTAPKHVEIAIVM
jgi:hypothetical protein